MKKYIIIVFLLLFLFKLFLSYLDYKGSSSPELYTDLLKYFTPDDITKGEIYARRGFGAAVVRNFIFSFTLLVISFSPLSVMLEKFCDTISGKRFFITSLLFIMILYTFLFLLSLPFNFYFSYILEHSFGFSNMTAAFWFRTKLKSFIMMLFFISIIGSAALIIIKKAGFYSVFIVPTGGLLIGLVMMIVYPLAVLPLFYQISKIDNPSLEKRIVELADKSGVTVDEIYVIKESDYSKHTNAFFVGFGNHKKIYLYDTLIQNNSEKEIISILAHEIGHWVYSHNIKGVMIGFILSLCGFLMIYFCVYKMQNVPEFSTRWMYSPSMLPVYLLLFIIFSSLTDPVEMSASREMEKNADYYALKVTGDPDSFIASEIRIARDNSAKLNRHYIPAFFRNSHPMTIERINMAERYKEVMLR